MEIAPAGRMRRIVRSIDQLSGWAYIALGIIVLGAVRVGHSAAIVARNAGGLELTSVLTFASFLLLLIFGVRRRQSSSIEAALEMLLAIAGSSVVGLAGLWPMLPAHLPISFASVLQANAGDQVSTVVFGLPIATIVLWLSRRWGSDSSVTERRLRVVVLHLRARADRRRRPRANDENRGGTTDGHKPVS